ncbi:MAG TPA: signal peptidase I, partial [Ktedonobacteraceae bacterium]|nr:signal peptidase I [Ktedonobacteraceae bacterium]
TQMRDLIEMVILVAVIFLAIRLTVETHSIDGPSMQPNFFTNQSVITNKLAYLFGKPQRGDVIILHPPTAPQDFYIKRLIGLPGDTITLGTNYVAVNGVRLNEPYVTTEDNCTIYVTAQLIENAAQCKTQTITLGPNQYWVMGDNRQVSDDSRIFGPITFQEIVGKASFVAWPLSDIHAVNMYHGVFAHVPAPKQSTGQTVVQMPLMLGTLVAVGK